jgi:hypothetical protein
MSQVYHVDMFYIPLQVEFGADESTRITKSDWLYQALLSKFSLGRAGS